MDQYILYRDSHCKSKPLFGLPEHKKRYLEHNPQLPLCLNMQKMISCGVKPQFGDKYPKQFVGLKNSPSRCQKNECNGPYSLHRGADYVSFHQNHWHKDAVPLNWWYLHK